MAKPRKPVDRGGAGQTTQMDGALFECLNPREGGEKEGVRDGQREKGMSALIDKYNPFIYYIRIHILSKHKS